METANFIFNFSVILMSITIFFMKFTAPNQIFEFFMRGICKIIPLFCMLYASIQLFKQFGII